MNEAIALAFGVALGAGAVFAANHGALVTMRDAVRMLSAALHPAAPMPASLERADDRGALEQLVVQRDPAELRGERVQSIRARLQDLAMRSGNKMTDAELDEEAERLASTDVHGGP
jgi:hypothetical protein